MWANETILWEDSEHPWNQFGAETSAPDTDDNTLHAKGLIIWKKSTFSDFVEKILAAFDATNEYLEDINIITGFSLVVTTANLFPLHLKIVKEDEAAEKFLSLLHSEKGQQFFLKNELDSLNSLNELIAYFIQKSLLTDANDRYIINGKVLNRSHIKN